MSWDTSFGTDPGRATRLARAVGGMDKIGFGQTAVASQDPALPGRQLLGGERGGLAGAIRFAEDDVADLLEEESVGGSEQALLRIDHTEDQVWVLGGSRQETAGCFETGVDGLNGDLRRRQVPADQDVQVSNLRVRSVHRYFSSP
jgi:hypothetical protein